MKQNLPIANKRLNSYLFRLRRDGTVPKYGWHLGCCPACGSGHIEWCSLSVRSYCADCSWWAPINLEFGQFAIIAGIRSLKAVQTRVGVEKTNILVGYDKN